MKTQFQACMLLSTCILINRLCQKLIKKCSLHKNWCSAESEVTPIKLNNLPLGAILVPKILKETSHNQVFLLIKINTQTPLRIPALNALGPKLRYEEFT
jgi:hypothetical protein